MFKERYTEELNKGLRKVNLLSVVKGYLVEEKYGANNLIQSLIDGNVSLIHDKSHKKNNYLKKASNLPGSNSLEVWWTPQPFLGLPSSILFQHWDNACKNGVCKACKKSSILFNDPG